MLQREALEILKTGANVFLTGVPGAGKTYVINEYIKYLEDKGVYPAVTASTGIAATHIGGTTIHAFSGIGIEKNIDGYKLEKIMEREKLVKRIQNTKVLIIDEISMLDANTLDNVNLVLKEIKNPTLPFGGVQIIFVGDFFQLPPVTKRGEYKNYAFAASSWRDAKPLTCYLEEQFRQSDETFTKLLLAIRENSVDEMHVELLNELVKKTNKKFGIKPVKAIEEGEYEEETVELEVFEDDNNEVEKGAVKHKMQGVRLGQAPLSAPGILSFPVPTKSVYNSLGILELHSHNKNVDEINDVNLKNLPGKEYVYRMITTGKAQLVEGLMKNCLSPEILKLKVGAKVIFTKNSLEGEYANGTMAEVVELETFSIKAVTKEGKMVEVKQTDWSLEDDGKVKAKLTQYPLRLAWAITVHKSQGMSLDEAVLSLSDTFEYGQGYVALSRVRSLDGLYLKGFNPKSLRVNESISEFDEKIRKDSRFIQNKFKKADLKKLEETQNAFILKSGGKVEGGAKREATQKKQDTYEITLDLVKREMKLDEIIKERNLSVGTVVSHLEELYKKKKVTKLEISKVVDDRINAFSIPNEVKKMFKKHKHSKDEDNNVKLGPVFKDLKEKYTYDDLRIYRIFI